MSCFSNGAPRKPVVSEEMYAQSSCREGVCLLGESPENGTLEPSFGAPENVAILPSERRGPPAAAKQQSQ